MSTLSRTADVLNFPLTTDKDRRRSTRRSHVIKAWIVSPTACDPSEKIEVTSVNISRHGVAFNCRQPFPPATFFVMEIGIGDQRIRTEVRIISCRPVESDQYEVGAEFH